MKCKRELIALGILIPTIYGLGILNDELNKLDADRDIKADTQIEEVIEEKYSYETYVPKEDSKEELDYQSYEWYFNDIYGHETTLYFDTKEEMEYAKNILSGCSLVVIEHAYHLILNDETDVRVGNVENLMPTIYSLINY